MSISSQICATTMGTRGPFGVRYLMVSGLLMILTQDLCRAEVRTSKWNSKPVASNALLVESVVDHEEAGETFQRYRLVCPADVEVCRIEAQLPASRLINEFRAVTRVNSTHSGIQLALRLVLPSQIDPRTRQPLVTWIGGNRSSETAEWQELSVQLTADEVEAQLRRVRQELYPSAVDSQGMYVEGCGLIAEIPRGNCVIDLAPVQYGPVIPLGDSQLMSPVSISESESDVPGPGRVRVERSHLEFDGQPSFLLIFPDHGESPEEIRFLGANAVWLADYRPSERSKELRKSGLMVAVTPPHPRLDPADFRRPVQGLMPLELLAPDADLFILGNDVSAKQSPHLLAWARETLSADRRMQRPIMADVKSLEGLASRQVDLVGLAEPTLHQNATFGEFRDRLFFRGRTASQLTLPWAWVHTESPASMTSWRQSLGLPPLVVEPEQITMQVIAALSAGVRGIGFWKTRALAGDSSEAGLAVSLACREIKVLQPWLISSRVQSHIAIDTGSTGSGIRTDDKTPAWASALSSSPLSTGPSPNRRPTAPDAAMITGRNSSLVLAALWDTTSQFVPDSLYSKEGRLTVIASDTASASRVTMTGVHGQRRLEAAGGLPIHLTDFDQYEFLLIASDPQAISDLGRRVELVKAQAATQRCTMAEQKFQRVSGTCAVIDMLQTQIPDNAATTLQNAAQHLSAARNSLYGQQFAEADRHARNCLRSLRIVQSAYWRLAISGLPSPTASPFTIAFSSVPDHWEMMRSIANSGDSSGELLTSGAFDGAGTLTDAGWTTSIANDKWQTRINLTSERSGKGRYLQLAAWRPETPSVPESDPTLVIASPEMQLSPGDIVEIRAHVRRGTSVRAKAEFPLMIFDSELGQQFAVRPVLEPTWHAFRMYRVVASDEPFQVFFGLMGASDVHVDSVSVRRVGVFSRSVQGSPGGNLPVQEVSDSTSGLEQSSYGQKTGDSLR